MQHVNPRKADEHGEETIVLTLQDVAHRKAHLGFLPTAEGGPERRHGSGPVEVGLAKLPTKELLLGKHDPLIVQSVEEQEDDGEPDVADVEDDAEPHQQVAEVQGMTADAVHPEGV